MASTSTSEIASASTSEIASASTSETASANDLAIAIEVEIETIGNDDVPEVSASQDDELTAVEYEIVDGPRTKSKLLWIPIEKQFYVKNTVTKRGTSYLCHTANCKLRVILNSDLCYKTNSAEHHHANCEPDYKKYKALN